MSTLSVLSTLVLWYSLYAIFNVLMTSCYYMDLSFDHKGPFSVDMTNF